MEIPGIYMHIKSGNSYIVYRAILNKTEDSLMVMYGDGTEYYVRETYDFMTNFKFIEGIAVDV